MVSRGISKDLAAEWTEVVGSAWNVSRTRSTVALSVLGQPLSFLSRTDASSKNFLFHLRIVSWEYGSS